MQPVFRFAPSPNGLLHLGHAYSALLNEQEARRHGGRLLLRIEDIDRLRSRSEHVQAIFEDLDWLGIAFDGPVRFQSAHMDDYRKAADTLQQRGLLFACDCTRQRVAREAQALSGPDRLSTDPDGAPLYPGHCLHRPPHQDQPVAWRLRMEAALQAVAVDDLSYQAFAGLRDEQNSEWITRPIAPQRWGDAVLLRKDIATSYHLSVVVDDALQGVTHVVRGGDLEAATDLHRLLQALLGLPSPHYDHHDLVTDADGTKLAKSRMSKPLRQWREEGASPAMIRNILGFAATESHSGRP